MKNKKKKPSLYKYGNFLFWAFIYFTSGKQDNALKNDFFFLINQEKTKGLGILYMVMLLQNNRI